MALISAKTIITSLCLFHITLGFFFLTNPASLSDQAVVYVIGEAMGMPAHRSFDTRSPPLALLSVVLIFFGLSDLLTLSYPESVSMITHWGAQAPLRLFISLVTLFYTFFTSQASPFYQSSGKGLNHPSAHVNVPGYKPSGWGGEMLKNRVFFAIMFVEMISWFWVWVTLREERKDVLLRASRAKRRGSRGYEE